MGWLSLHRAIQPLLSNLLFRTIILAKVGGNVRQERVNVAEDKGPGAPGKHLVLDVWKAGTHALWSGTTQKKKSES